MWHRGTLDMDNDLTMRTIVVLIIAAIHGHYFGLIVTKRRQGSARKYARELILSTETLSSSARTPAGRKQKAT